MVLLFLVESFFTAWAFMNASRLQNGNIFTGILFLLCFLFYRYSAKIIPATAKTKTHFITSVILSILFTLFYMGVDAHNYVEALENKLFRLVILAATALGFFFLFFHLLRLLFALIANKERCMNILARPVFARLAHLYDAHIGVLTFLICMLGFLPYYLYQFPGIMTPDSLNQLEQVLGLIPYSNHHPFVHTMLIKLLYSFGSLFTDNMVYAMAFYTFFQMCILALSVTCLIKTIQKLNVNLIFCILITAFYAFVPYNDVFAVTVWKDVLFSAGVLFFTTALLRLYVESRQGALTVSSLILYSLSGLMVCLLRSNGWYAFVLSLPFLIYFFRKNKKIMLPLQLGIFLIALLVKGPVMNAIAVTQPDFVESVSIPLQQISRVICNDRELSPEQWNLVHSVMDTTYIKELYHPNFADNIKELVRAGHPDYLAGHKGDYLKLWLTLSLTYPKDYLDAYIQQTLGYWYPDSFYTVAENEGISATALGISHSPIIGGPLVVKAKEIAIKLGGMLPLYGLIWSMGTMFWVLLICIGCGIVRKEFWKLFLYLPGLTVMLTVLIATPVATEFRYAYSLVYTLPLYLILAVWDPDYKTLDKNSCNRTL